VLLNIGIRNPPEKLFFEKYRLSYDLVYLRFRRPCFWRFFLRPIWSMGLAVLLKRPVTFFQSHPFFAISFSPVELDFMSPQPIQGFTGPARAARDVIKN